MNEALLNAKLEAVEARTDTKFAQLIGKIDTLGEKLTSVAKDLTSVDSKVSAVDTYVRSARTTIIATIIGTAIAVAALTFAAVQIFQGGMSTTASAYQSGMAAAQSAGNHK